MHIKEGPSRSQDLFDDENVFLKKNADETWIV